MPINEIVAFIAGFAVVLTLLIVFITLLRQVMKEREFENTPQYKRTPQEQVDDYATVNDIIQQ